MDNFEDFIEAFIDAKPPILKVLKLVVDERNRLRKRVEELTNQVKTLQMNLDIERGPREM